MKILATLAIGLAAGAALAQPSISSLTQPGLKDLSFTWVVESANQAELAKINRDFAQSMRIKRSTVEMMEPFMLRMESTVEDSQVIFIVNGGKKVTRIPRSGLVARDDVSRAPGKRQTWFDFGILTPSLFSNYFSAKFLRTEARGDLNGTHVFDIAYVASLNDKTRHRIWIDPTRKIVRKREWYGQDGTLRAVFSYQSPIQSNGQWVPSRLVVTNASGRQAGVSVFQNIRANGGIAASRFATN